MLKILSWLSDLFGALGLILFGGWITGVMSGLNGQQLYQREILLAIACGFAVLAWILRPWK